MKRQVTVILLAGLIQFLPAVDSAGLLPYLADDAGWSRLKITPDGQTLYRKDLQVTFPALKIEQEVAVAPEVVMAVFNDIENYPAFFKSASRATFRVLRREGQRVDAYQHLNVPLLADRHYLFRLNGPQPLSNTTGQSASWVVLDPAAEYGSEIDLARNQQPNLIYLRYGAGQLRVEPTAAGLTRISYRLILDPGGRLPLFLVEMLNEKGLTGLFRDVIDESLRRSGEALVNSPNQRD